jgi:hypothetical protein
MLNIRTCVTKYMQRGFDPGFRELNLSFKPTTNIFGEKNDYLLLHNDSIYFSLE